MSEERKPDEPLRPSPEPDDGRDGEPDAPGEGGLAGDPEVDWN